MPGSATRRLKYLPIGKVRLWEDNPRRMASSGGLDELVGDIGKNGILQPLTVRPTDEDGVYQVVAGARRRKAAEEAGLDTVPCLILEEVGDEAAFEAALQENIQREDLSPVDEALAIRAIRDAGSRKLTVRQLEKRLNKGKDYIQNRLSLLGLPAEILVKIVREPSPDNGEISEGHARCLRSLESEEEQLEAYRAIVERNLTTRQTRALVSGIVGEPETQPASALLDEPGLKFRRFARGFTARFTNVRNKAELLAQLDHLRAEVERLEL